MWPMLKNFFGSINIRFWCNLCQRHWEICYSHIKSAKKLLVSMLSALFILIILSRSVNCLKFNINSDENYAEKSYISLASVCMFIFVQRRRSRHLERRCLRDLQLAGVNLIKRFFVIDGRAK
jgi:hypothetical protein